MRFVIIYRNRPDIRQHVEQILRQGIAQGVAFHIQPQNTPIFQTRPFWPTTSELMSLPMTHQCEEVEFKDDKFVTIHQMVIDIEVKILNKTEEKESKELENKT